MSQAVESGDGRTRTFTGCRTCRTRHAKCDETQPECTVCRRMGLKCGGYKPSLHWVIEDIDGLLDSRPQATRGSGFRFQLFTESERRQMSNQMSDAMGQGSSLDCTLARMDALCDKRIEKGQNGPAFSPISNGPFTVFKTPTGPIQPVPSFDSCSVESPTRPRLEGSFYVDEEDSAEAEVVEQLPILNWADTQDSSLAFIPEPLVEYNDCVTSVTQGFPVCNNLPWGLHLNLPDTLPPPVASDELEQSSDDTGLAEISGIQSLFSQADHNTSSEAQTGFGNDKDGPLPFNIGDGITLTSPRSVLSSYQSGSNVPQHTRFLFRFYRQQLGRTARWMPADRQSPWQVIFLPCALETFSELALWNTTSDTRFAILFTLLSQSAFLLHRSGMMSTNDKVFSLGVAHLKTAQNHLRRALDEHLNLSKRSKYQELLMATLAVVMTSVYHAPEIHRAYLYDAERLICHHGFNNTYPTCESRILHHMYTHLRVLGESFSPVSAKLVNNSSSNTALSPARQFRVTADWLNTGLDAASEKPPDLGFRDIHLQSQGRWLQTMYPSIYGIPESLMTLFSQTVSAANEKDWLEGNQPENREASNSLNTHIKTLEESVWSWTLAEDVPGIGLTKPQYLTYADEQQLLHYQSPREMTLAIHQALLIYFYRRIHNVNSMLLQDLVKKTFDHVESWVDDMIADLDFAPSLAWPVFVAACEAMTSLLREQASCLLDKTNSSSSVLLPAPAKDIVSKVWQCREETGDLTLSWKEVISEAGVH